MKEKGRQSRERKTTKKKKKLKALELLCSSDFVNHSKGIWEGSKGRPAKKE